MSKPLIILIILLILLAALLLAMIDWTARYAHDRKCPQLPKGMIKMLMGFQTQTHNGPAETRRLAEELRRNASIRVELTARDGIPLVAHYYPCADHKRIVIACHGWRSNWSFDYRTVAPFLHDHETSVLLIEARAHGESGGRYMTFGARERYDIADWTNLVDDRFGHGVPIYVMGMSCGALHTLMSLNAGLNEQVKGVIEDSGSGSARDFCRSAIRNLHLPPALFYPFTRLFARLRIGKDVHALGAYEAVSTSQYPILFIHGTRDQIASRSVMEQLYELCPAPKFKLVVEGANHMRSCFVDPDGYQRQILAFFTFCES